MKQKPRDTDRTHSIVREKVAHFPHKPGVYIMRDHEGKTLYVGKARDLNRRVRSYFTPGSSDTRILLPGLLAKVADVTYLVTATESEAFILENNLIKKHRPAYNLRLKDDKTYLSIKVTVQEKWPRVLITRRLKEDGAVYFGPYASASKTRNLLRLIKQVFTLRTCSNGFFSSRKRPCIQYEIGRCGGPCCGLVTEEEYRKQVAALLAFLRGNVNKLLKTLTAEMEAAAARREYERAAVVRDRIQAVHAAMERQAVHEAELKDLDVFAMVQENDAITVQVLFVRNGRVLDAAPYHLRSRLPADEILRSFLSQFYLSGHDVPGEIVVPVFPTDRSATETMLREKRGKKVRFFLGKRGERRLLLDLALRNATEAAKGNLIEGKQRREAVRELSRALEMTGEAERIECFDISTTGGTHAVGSMAVMINGKPDKDQYRHFRVKTVAGMDDFKMLQEVITRRLKAADTAAPADLMVVDGGRGQVSRAHEVLKETGHGTVALAGIAKRRHNKPERIFLPERSEPVQLAEDTPASRLLQELRDEAHRFAITYHRKLRRQNALTSGLETIKGLGPRRIRHLFETIGGVGQLRRLSLEELKTQGKLPGVAAENLYAFLHKTGGKNGPAQSNDASPSSSVS